MQRPPRPPVTEHLTYPLATPFDELPPPLGYYARLPRDIQRELFLRFSYDDVMKLCESGWFSWICKDVDYWSKRVGVSRATFEDEVRRSKRSYPETYLELRHGEMARKLYADGEARYPSGASHHIWTSAMRNAIYSRDPNSLQRNIPQEDLRELIRYILLQIKTPGKIRDAIRDVLLAISNEPDLLCWFAELGIRLTSHTATTQASRLADRAFESGGIRAVRCLEALANIDWLVVLLEAKNLEFVRYIMEEKGVDNQRVITTAYRIALRKGRNDIAEYLYSYLN